MIGANTRELIEDAERLTASVMAENDKRFDQAVAKAIAGSPLIGVYAPGSVTALQLARTLRATALRLKELAASRATFVESLEIAVRVLSAPLRGKG
jgi:hypothetical protein